MVAENGYHLNTGFLSTPFLCEVLAKYGYADTAYKLLLQDTAPAGSMRSSRAPPPSGRHGRALTQTATPANPLNHYSYGAICGWLFGGVCGIHLAGETLTIAPPRTRLWAGQKQCTIPRWGALKAAGSMRAMP